MVEVDGQTYFEYRLELQYTPKEEGDYVFGPVTFKGFIPVSVDESGNADGRDIFAVGRAATVRVVPPPLPVLLAKFFGKCLGVGTAAFLRQQGHAHRRQRKRQQLPRLRLVATGRDVLRQSRARHGYIGRTGG